MTLRVLAFLVVSTASAVVASELENPFPEGCWGVYGRGKKWDPEKVNRHTTPMLHGVTMSVSWKDLEPEPGKFQFEALFGDRLKAARDNDYRL